MIWVGTCLNSCLISESEGMGKRIMISSYFYMTMGCLLHIYYALRRGIETDSTLFDHSVGARVVLQSQATPSVACLVCKVWTEVSNSSTAF